MVRTGDFTNSAGMPNYRRNYLPGGTYFFTLKTERNLPIFNFEDNVKLLGTIIRETQQRWPFEIPAIVLLPDHLHAIWSLPRGDDRYPARWGWLKKEFTKRYLAGGGLEQMVSPSKRSDRRRGVWQRRFWEHTIEDDDDFDNHFDYIHWNPVKHGYVPCPKEWPHSSFHRWVKAGVYDMNWGCGLEPDNVKQIVDAGE